MRAPGMSRRAALRGIAAAGLPAGLLAGAGPAQAADYPDRTIRLINPYATGGTVEVVARWMADKMGQKLGQTMIVDARPGGAGTVAAAYVAKGPKDGYMVYIGTSSTLGYAKLLQKDLPYEPVKDFTPVAMVGSVPIGIFTGPDTGFNTIQDLIAAAKAKPGQISYGSSGAMTLTHLAGEMFCQRAGIKMIHVPYNGSGGAKYFTDLVGGQTQALMVGVTGGLELAKAGRIKLLATATATRARGLENVPALGEIFPGFDVPTWFALAVAAGTPEPIVHKLEGAALSVLRDPATRTAFDTAGVEAGPFLGSAEMSARVNTEMQMWEKLLAQAGLLK